MKFVEKFIYSASLLLFCSACASESDITPYKYTSAPSEYTIPSSSKFSINRPDSKDPQILYYVSKPKVKSFPLVILCGGSSTKESASSIIHLHRYFLEECIDLDAAVMTVEQWGINGSEVDVNEWFSHYTRSQRLSDHKAVLNYLLKNPIEGWNGKFIFIGVSEGGPLVTSLTEAYSASTLATVNWSGAGDWSWDDELWVFIQNIMQQDPPCPHGSKFSNCSDCNGLKSTLSSKNEYSQFMHSTLKNPTSEESFFGMSYLYHADALTYSKPNYSKLTRPYLVVAGGQDTLLESSDAFVKKAKEAGAPITYMRVEDMDHYVTKRPDIIKASFKWLKDMAASCTDEV